jgi:hypothetical protein
MCSHSDQSGTLRSREPATGEPFDLRKRAAAIASISYFGVLLLPIPERCLGQKARYLWPQQCLAHYIRRWFYIDDNLEDWTGGV